MIPLLNLGTALGGFTQGYQNAENNRIQNALRQIALSQALAQQRGQRLAGLGLSSGLLDQLQTNAPQMLPQGPVSSQSPVPTPPMPGASSMPAQPTQTAAAPTEPPIDPDEARLPDLVDPQGAAVPGTYKPALPGPWQQEYITPQPTAAQMAPRPSPTDTQTASAGASDAQPVPPETHVDATLPTGQTLGIPELFRTVDPGRIAQGLARLAPAGTDPADIYQATADLLKLANGNKAEQWQAALLGKELGFQYHAADAAANRESRERIAGQASADRRYGVDTRATTAATAETGRESRFERGQAGQTERQQTGIDARTQAQLRQQEFQKQQQTERLNARASAQADAKATNAEKAQRGAVETQIRNANSRINQMLAMTPPPKKADLDAAIAARDKLQQQLDTMTAALLKR